MFLLLVDFTGHRSNYIKRILILWLELGNTKSDHVLRYEKKTRETKETGNDRSFVPLFRLNGNHRRGQVAKTEIDRSQLAVCSLYTKGVFSSRKVREKVVVAHFGFIWQLLSNHGVISLKRFVSSFTTKLCN